MLISKLRMVLGLSFLMLAMGGFGRLAGDAKAAGPALVLTMDYTGGGLAFNPANHPYMRVYSNGLVTVTNPVKGAQTHAQLNALQLKNLLAFVTVQNQFLTLNTAQIANAIAAQNPMFVIGDGTTTTIALRVGKTTHVVNVYAADTYLGAFPGIKPLAEFVAIEQRLQQIANSAK